MSASFHKYTKNHYSKEQIEYWAECERKSYEFNKKHSSEVIKDYNIDGYVIRCIQRKYDKVLKKENEYGIQVWTKNPNECGLEEIFDSCINNEWFNNPCEANNYFLQMKEMCKL